MKKIINILLATVVCAMLIATVSAADLTADHGTHGDGWTALSMDSLNTNLSEGNYYLTQDINLTGKGSITVASGSTVTVCLNGYDVMRTDKADRIFYTEGTLTICDCCQNANVTEGFIDISEHVWMPKGAATPAKEDITYNFTSGGTIYGGYSSTSGGGIYCAASGNVNLQNINIAGNTCAKYAGGIYIDEATENTSTTVENINLVGNTAANGGGIYNASKRSMSIKNCTVAYNKATQAGGAFYSTYATTLRNCTFTNNTATNGGVGRNTGTLNSYDTEFSNNTATSGGALYVTGNVNLYDGTVISGNTATGNGGGIIVPTVSGTERKVTIAAGVKIINNNADIGGGICANIENAVINMKGGEISGNSAKTRGGGVDAYRGEINLNGGTVSGNTTAGRGSAASVYMGKVNRTGSVVEGTIAMVGNSSEYTENGTVLFGSKTGIFQSKTAEFQLNKDNDLIAIEGGAKLTGEYTVDDCKELLLIGGLEVADGATLSTYLTGQIKMLEEAAIDGQTKITGASGTLNVASYNSYHTVVYDQGTSTWSVSVTNEAKVGDTEYKWLSQAFAAAEKTGETVTMLRNVESNEYRLLNTELTYYYVFDEGTINLDMAGYTLQRDEYGLRFNYNGYHKIYSSTGRGTLDIGSLAIYAYTGGFQLDNVAILCHDSQAISYSDHTGTFTDNYIKNCVIYNDRWVTFAFNYKGDMSNELITIENTDLISGSTAAPLGAQTSAVDPSVKIGAGVRLYTLGDAYVASPVKVHADSKTPVKAATKRTFAMGDVTVEGLTMWYVPYEVGTADELQALMGQSNSGEIVLTGDIETTDLVLRDSSLDLNGNTLIVDTLDAENAQLVDTTNDTGLLIVKTADGLKLNPANEQMVVGDAENGYMLTEIANQVKFVEADEGKVNYLFNFYLKNPNAKAYAIDNPESIDLGINFTWGIQKQSVDAPVTMEGIGNVVEYLLKNPKSGLKLTVIDLEDVTNFKISAFFATNGVNNDATTKTANVPEIDKVLFIGNSHTHTNSMHEIFKGIARAAGYKTLNVAKVTEGSCSLKKHYEEEDKRSQIDAYLEARDVDYVVLQEANGTMRNRYEEFVEYAGKWNEVIRSYDATPMLYATWGQRDNYLASGTSGETTRSMAYRVARQHQSIGDSLNIPVGHAGLAFLDVYENHEEIDLYYSATDGNHASYAGSYLAAMTLFARMFNEDPTTVQYDGRAGKLTPEVAAILRQAARDAVFNTPEIPMS